MHTLEGIFNLRKIFLFLETNLLPTFWACFKRKKAAFFGALHFGGNQEDLRGTKNAKIAPNFGTLFWAVFTTKLGI